ncbi:orotidine 5'-phosphate decarboxylase [Thioflexithrix psekupsensis]|uniref:Orotidine 5'-phosphate decarboxylase n=1 Tax=Thioflexithrix psekupsensis TaxID=1570016 RepID=A0A251X9I6_9GAMM|nr:orotidine 5'-phosphate decarboxylase [Thioflexithrix psekupsensis]
MSKTPLIIALDFPTAQKALAFVQPLDAQRYRVKVGLELFTREGPALIEALHRLGFDVFLDLKFHDIPNTVARACASAAELGVWMLNVHALGGRDMLLAAREAIEAYQPRPLLIAVSILTSLEQSDLYATGLHGTLEENVLRLARLVKANQLDGLVCSPHELTAIKRTMDKDDPFVLVTPGIRPVGSESHDQKRIMTPKEALDLGATYLVLGRPVTQADAPQAVLAAIEASLQ